MNAGLTNHAAELAALRALQKAPVTFGWPVLNSEAQSLAADRAFNIAKNDGSLQREADMRALERQLNDGSAT